VDLGLAPGQGVKQADHHPGAAHVPFYVFHSSGRFDRYAAGVEGDALADEGDRPVCQCPGSGGAGPFQVQVMRFE
jgi:hypothetical protein